MSCYDILMDDLYDVDYLYDDHYENKNNLWKTWITILLASLDTILNSWFLSCIGVLTEMLINFNNNHY